MKPDQDKYGVPWCSIHCDEWICDEQDGPVCVPAVRDILRSLRHAIAEVERLRAEIDELETELENAEYEAIHGMEGL